MWCFLSNCHLSVNLLPELENIMDDMFEDQSYDQAFRVYLSAAPVEGFSISLLQRSVKSAVEPPRGIKANMMRMYENMGKNFTRCEKDMEFRKAVYGLVWFHAILIERKKFKTLGWNVQYSFNDSDYSVCEDTLALNMGRYKEGVKNPDFEAAQPVPWQAVVYLVAQANYGGRITDNNDRKLVDVYCKELFTDELIAIEKWRPAGTQEYNYQYTIDEANVKSPE